MPSAVKGSSKRGGGRRRRVKTGCRTCKIRKVKCDEGHPICNRCLETGRICEGYGIWGGGENHYSHQVRMTRASQAPTPTSLLTSGTDEDKALFDWFRCRTAPKLAGSFMASFWTTLLFQASVNEPAVLHAILALSSFHKTCTLLIEDSNAQGVTPSTQAEGNALQYYVKAVRHLQPHFSRKDKESFRIALITCAVFVSFELLRGHFGTAQALIENGVRLLDENHMILYSNDEGPRPGYNSGFTDDWITEALSRIQLQLKLFSHGDRSKPYQHICVTCPVNGTFNTVQEAWRQLGRLLNNTLHLTHLAHQQEGSTTSAPATLLSVLEDRQRMILNELKAWFKRFEVINPSWSAIFGGRNRVRDVFALLASYHTMITIMAHTALQPNDESVYDLYIDQFMLLIKYLLILSYKDPRELANQFLPGQGADIARSMVDCGWIPPIHYIVTKCRVHHLRLQALRLLKISSHREGMWDAESIGCVGRKVMELEERDFYAGLEMHDDFPLQTPPRSLDLDLPVLPVSYRLRDVEVVMAGEPVDRILLYCSQKWQGGYERVMVSEFDVHAQCWRDREYRS